LARTRTRSRADGAGARTTRTTPTTKRDPAPGGGEGATVAFSLGANLGNEAEVLRRAVLRLGAIVRRPRVSSLYRTAPLEAQPQTDFLNAALVGTSTLGPRQLLAVAQRLEQEAGRRPTAPPGLLPGPRVLDIDLLWHGDLVLREPGLELPHPRLRRRRFVLEPLVEIAPEEQLPPDGVTVAAAYSRLLAGDGCRQRVEHIAARGWHHANEPTGSNR
jgi:2-amino-4-hydroxy-6-hydroxymethyldihydropteridine diphosphokinase